MIEISYGAAGEVTGSCHLLKFKNGLKVLIDCGMFQGLSESKNFLEFEFNPKKIDYLLLTHGHLDHIGRIPVLFKRGFRGKIIASSATLEIAKIVLLDSAKLMSEEYKTLFKKARQKGEEKKIAKPLFGKKDIKRCFRSIKIIKAEYGEKIKLKKGVYAVFRNAGHILGSAFIEIGYKEKGEIRKVVFSGDLGNRHNGLLPSPQTPYPSQTLFTEATYGDRLHKSYQESINEFKDAVLSTLQRGGCVLIPSFAIERTQQILCLLKEMREKKELSSEVKVFLDSPMAVRTTKIYFYKTF